MAVFTAIAAAVVSAIGITGTAATIFTAIGATVLSVGASRLLMKRQMRGADSGGSGGARIQLPPATENKLPVVYGSAYIGGSVTDAKISSDNKTMWYCVAMAEVTDTGGYTFDTSNIYYNGLKVQFGANGVVTGLINNTTPATLDTKMSGQINIYLFQNGATTPGQNTSLTAQQVMQDSQIPAGQRWTATDLMTDCAFAIVKVKYNAEKGTTSLGGLTARITNSLTQPGDVINDYMQNTRYGCAIPAAQIDSASLAALNTYSDYNLPYTDPVTGPSTQKRYRINGPIATGNDCLTNLQILVDSCDSWLQYSEFLGQWRVIINQSYTDYTTIGDLFLVDSNNLVGGINVAPINLNETFNQLEVAYPNESVRDQTDYQLIELEDYAAVVMSPNEAVNKLDVDYPVVNTSVQSVYLGVRRLLQSREDLTVTFQLDYSGIQVEAGDVIRVKQEVYGWDVLNPDPVDPTITYGKLFRVANVAEEKYQDGSLGVRITAFEYNDTVYADFALTAFLPDPNTGIGNPNFMDVPLAPRLYFNGEGSINRLDITGFVPEVGLFTELAFNYGYTTDVNEHRFYKSTSSGTNTPLTSVLGTSDLIISDQYTILTLGTTNWLSIGVTKVDLSTAPTVGGFLVIGREYIIETVGTTDFTLVGAASNTPGEIFIATGLGTGTGTAFLTDFIATGTDAGTGTVNTSFTIQMVDLPAGTYYWSVTARNPMQGRDSPAAGPIVWAGDGVSETGNVTDLPLITSVGNVVTHTGISVPLGATAIIIGGTGEFAPNTYVTQINSPTEFEVSAVPTVTINNALGQFIPTNSNSDLGSGGNPGTETGGIGGDNIYYNTINFNNLSSGTGVKRVNGSWRWETAESGVPASWTPIDLPTAIGYSANLPATVSAGKWQNVSYYLDGTTVGSTVTYPFAQGTSSTSIGYQVNSSGPFAPSRAEQLDVETGEDDWWPIGYDNYTFEILSGQFVQFNINAAFMSTSDTTIQILPFNKFSSTNTVMSADTSHDMKTVELKANYPYVYSVYSSLVGVTPGTNNGCGLMIRNMVGGTRVYITLSDGIFYEAKDG